MASNSLFRRFNKKNMNSQQKSRIKFTEDRIPVRCIYVSGVPEQVSKYYAKL